LPASALRIPLLSLVLAALVATPASARQYPETIPLPPGWQPEGIATGFGNQFFSGSRAGGGIYRGDLKTGTGKIIVPQRDGGAATGLKVDRRNRLFVSGAATGTARVYKAGSGRLLREYRLTTDPTFINDVTLTRRGAYFTDSINQRLYVLKLKRHGKLPKRAKTLPLTGDLQYDSDPETFELNGIVAAAHGKLIAVQSRLGKLFLIDKHSGRTREIDLGGATTPNGDGLLLDDRTLYVVQNRDNKIAVIRLGHGLRRGEIERYLTDDDFDVPTTIAARGGFLWAVNARFTTPPTPTTSYDVVRVSR
jgi:sugar lactone lactonase YvrE